MWFFNPTKAILLGDESEKSSNYEDIIGYSESNEQFMESFCELFARHDDDGDSIT